MAALTSIRSKGKLIAICVGGALLAFVLGDFINSGATIFGASMTKMGEINGNTVDYNDFMNKVRSREEFTKIINQMPTLESEASDQIREYCWQQEIRMNTIGEFAKKQGIRVTDEEIQTLINFGNVTTSMYQLASRQTGAYNPSYFSRLASGATSGNVTDMFVWNTLEKDMRDERQLVKYVGMVSAGLYVTKAEVEQEFANRTQMSDIKYVAIPYSDIKDDEVKVSDADIMAVFNQNKGRYELMQSQESRDIAYMSYNIIASDKDSADALKIANEIAAGFDNVDAASVKDYVNSKSDVPYVNYNYSKGDITNDVVDSLMFSQQPGFVYGPYVEGGYYKSARLINKQMLPDSVEISHILIQHVSSDFSKTKYRADSILDVYNQGIDFNALAAEYSMIQGAKLDSGKLGWMDQNTRFFPEEVHNACFTIEKGKTAVLQSDYGYHIIKVTNKTALKEKVSVGFASVAIHPSKQTRQEYYAKASMFAGTNRTPEQFKSAVEKDNLPVLNASVYSSQRAVNGVENSRELVRWAFNEDLCHQVSEVFEFGDRYIVAALMAVHPKGVVVLNDRKLECQTEAYNNAKGDVIVNKLGKPSSVDAVAAQMGKTVQEASNVNFEANQIAGMAFEPNVIAVAASLGQNQVSAPIKGKNAVYVVQNVSLTPAQAIQPINVTTDQNKMMMDVRNRAAYQVIQVSQKLGNIDDRRAKFF
ncbi:MAG: SurA N-terminal domain-containing protein [Bacteroidales bacterium]|nr:SurA N-terminal domain-containing protein [Bacteroidales bacterium]